MLHNILIVGLGGTGSYLVTPLIRFIRAKNIQFNNIIFADGDKYEKNNEDRQEFMNSWIGYNKAQYAFDKHMKMFPDISEKLTYVDEYVGIDKIDYLMEENGVTFICVDNNYFRSIADKRASELKNHTIISGGNDLLDGQVQIVQYKDGINITGNTLASRHPEISSSDKTSDRSIMTCEQLANLPGGGQIVVANMMSATVMLGYFINYISHPERKFYETFFNCGDMSFRTVET